MNQSRFAIRLGYASLMAGLPSARSRVEGPTLSEPTTYASRRGYSQRKALTGSTREPRWAGMATLINATPRNARAAIA